MAIYDPLHINRYYPAHKWREPPTPIGTLRRVAEKARSEGIEYVYVGNVGDPQLESTKCPRCGKMLVQQAQLQGLGVHWIGMATAIGAQGVTTAYQ